MRKEYLQATGVKGMVNNLVENPATLKVIFSQC